MVEIRNHVEILRKNHIMEEKRPRLFLTCFRVESLFTVCIVIFKFISLGAKFKQQEGKVAQRELLVCKNVTRFRQRNWINR